MVLNSSTMIRLVKPPAYSKGRGPTPGKYTAAPATAGAALTCASAAPQLSHGRSPGAVLRHRLTAAGCLRLWGTGSPLQAVCGYEAQAHRCGLSAAMRHRLTAAGWLRL